MPVFNTSNDLKNKSCYNLSPFNLFLLLVITFLALEKSLSEGTDVAITDRYGSTTVSRTG